MRHRTVETIELAHNEASGEGRFADASDMQGGDELLAERGAIVDEESTTHEG
jgi:hypothetical protein